MGEKWKELTEDEKKPYQEQAQKDKDRYTKEQAKYQNSK